MRSSRASTWSRNRSSFRRATRPTAFPNRCRAGACVVPPGSVQGYSQFGLVLPATVGFRASTAVAVRATLRSTRLSSVRWVSPMRLRTLESASSATRIRGKPVLKALCTVLNVPNRCAYPFAVFSTAICRAWRIWQLSQRVASRRIAASRSLRACTKKARSGVTQTAGRGVRLGGRFSRSPSREARPLAALRKDGSAQSVTDSARLPPGRVRKPWATLRPLGKRLHPRERCGSCARPEIRSLPGSTASQLGWHVRAGAPLLQSRAWFSMTAVVFGEWPFRECSTHSHLHSRLVPLP